MFYLKTKYFAKWAARQGITDQALRLAVREFEQNLFEADLGHHLFKKRIALQGRGKSGGARTILFYQHDQKLIFCFGFNKNQQDNLNAHELRILRKLADVLRGMTADMIKTNMKHKELVELLMTEDPNEKYD